MHIRRRVSVCIWRAAHGIVIVFLIAMLSGSVSAHRPLFAGERGDSPETAVRIPDATVSHVLYFELTADEPHFWFVFDVENPGRLPLQVALPVGVGSDDMEPVL